MLKRFVQLLFFIFLIVLAISTFLPTEKAFIHIYQRFWFKTLFLLFGIIFAYNAILSLKNRKFLFFMIHLGILFILLGGGITSYFAEEGFIEIKEGDNAQGYWVDDKTFRPLNFDLYLKDFSVEYYPVRKKGLKLVKSYKTHIEIKKDGKLAKDGIIEVNRPLGFKGFNFYQYGFDESFPNKTVLQVVKDPGVAVVYFGYIVFLLSLGLSLRRLFISVK